MKHLIITLLISAPALAGTCSQYELRGMVRVVKTGLFLVVAEKTQSQKTLPVYLKAQPRLSPYINHYVSLKAVVDKTQIVSIEEVDDAVPDPLNRNAATEMNQIKVSKCPSL